MKLSQLINRIAEDGIRTSFREYREDEPKRSGAIAGYEACRGWSPMKIGTLLVSANTAAERAVETHHPKTDEMLAFRAAVLWVAECASVVLQNQGYKMIVAPSPAAYLKVAELVGVASQSIVQ